MNKNFMFDSGDGGGEVVAREPEVSPWEFSGYSAAVEDEHQQRRTTSIDYKISQFRKNQPLLDHSGSDQQDGHPKVKVKQKAARKRSGEQPILYDSESEQGNGGTKRKVKRKGGRKRSGVDESGGVEESFAGAKVANDGGHTRETGNWEDDGEDSDQYHNQVAQDNFYEVLENSRQKSSEDEEDDDEGDNAIKNETLECIKAGSRMSGVVSHRKTNVNGKISENKTKLPGVSIEDGLLVHGKEGKQISEKFFSPANGASFSAKSFIELNISRPLVRACEVLGYQRPTPIQAACVPLALTGRDICGSAVTGSGKTAAFALPLLERLLFRPRRIPATRVLILTPTRELAVQVHSMIEKLAQYTDISCCLVVGGLSTKVQEVALRSHPDIVVATPGRMIDHLHNSQSVGLEELAILVLDEADRLLELGFRQEVHELVRLCPKRRQTMLFSATMTEEVAELIQLSLNCPVRLSADPLTQRPSTLSEEVIKLRPSHLADKEAVLLALCSRSFIAKVIIFSGTKNEAHRLKILFGLSHLKAAELHGNLTQAQRLDALESFRKQDVNFLIATDVAARGLDIIGVETVINFECPRDITTYVHRVGRTARAGRQGCAVTFVSEKDRSLLKALAKRAGSKLQSRKVSPQVIEKWQQEIEKMEEDVVAIIQEERKERILRKAEMEANKAQNMIEHEIEIFSRPKKTWFQSTKEKKIAMNTLKDARSVTDKKNISVNEFENLQKKAKRKLEKEKHLPRKKRRQLEAAREVESNDEVSDDPELKDVQEASRKTSGTNGKSTVEAAYRRAKAVKAVERAKEAGRFVKKNTGAKKMKGTNFVSRKEEMEQLFQGDVKDSKRQRLMNSSNKKRKAGLSHKGFKSKARYKRRK
ncbi:hypothetical protein O6H91_01G006000 [Diphasiastrum complanatum]|uniref:Uncharacterized protein n=1 Tax=Diphasiastrum complanatum TaxID=34168 RepID=A0ACC2EMW1_DIPCM|nr:hypothetical protein O6H91_01G006000 [Diphasiastrum complanatum]